MSLQERIAKLNAAAAGSSTAKAEPALKPGELKERRANFEKSETVPVVRGSFGLGAPSTAPRGIASDRNRVASASSSSYVPPTSSAGPNIGDHNRLRAASSNAAAQLPSSTDAGQSQTPVQVKDPPDGLGLRGKALLHDRLNISGSSSNFSTQMEPGMRTPGSVSSMMVETGSVSSSQGTAPAPSTAGPSAVEADTDAPEAPHTPVAERDAELEAVTPPAAATPTESTPQQAHVQATDEERAALTAERLQEYEDEETDKTRKPDEEMLSPRLDEDKPAFDNVETVNDKLESLKIDPDTQDEPATPAGNSADSASQLKISTDNEETKVSSPVEATSLDVEDRSPDDGRLSPATTPSKVRRRISSTSSISSSRRASKIIPDLPAGGHDEPETDLGDTSISNIDNPTPDQTPQLTSTSRFGSMSGDLAASADDGEEKEDIEDLHVNRGSTLINSSTTTSDTRTAHSSGDGDFPSAVSDESQSPRDIIDQIPPKDSAKEDNSVPKNVDEDNPKVKCSDCGSEVGLMELGDHQCMPTIVRSASTQSNMSSSSAAGRQAGDERSLSPTGGDAQLPRDLSRRDLGAIANAEADGESLGGSPLTANFPQPPTELPRQPGSTALPEEEGPVVRKRRSFTDSPATSAANSPTVSVKRSQYPPRPFDDDDEEYDDKDGAQGYATILKRT